MVAEKAVDIITIVDPVMRSKYFDISGMDQEPVLVLTVIKIFTHINTELFTLYILRAFRKALQQTHQTAKLVP
ncbi:hypothetical protein NM688_g3195 [Phlebia brevispora]|uniref:Uncharacterized protein n=1 Tax=Phlebia brevispora TaxID=194682 RepID=A0ACC1T6M2_9APHY|nr:hypothetical protein NM688_g3195 [Phlebia brevispora]